MNNVTTEPVFGLIQKQKHEEIAAASLADSKAEMICEGNDPADINVFGDQSSDMAAPDNVQPEGVQLDNVQSANVQRMDESSDEDKERPIQCSDWKEHVDPNPRDAINQYV